MKQVLANYAVNTDNSRGRRIPEESPAERSEFQRDRDRVIHSAAFRRLEYKTQVFVNHEGDLYRTRLTHSLEVAQIARSVARAMRLNEDLTEAISLAHDLGHTPFGHAGQHALNACMQDFGGFEHNLQSLRVVDELEHRYAAFAGLNLTFETREGILKHCSLSNARRLGDLGDRFILRRQPSLEAQLANLADEIAYNNHDVDDGLRSGLIDLADLTSIELFAEQRALVRKAYPRLHPRIEAHEIVRGMIGALVKDLVMTSRARIGSLAPPSIDAVRLHSAPLIGFSERFRDTQSALKRFLGEHLYRHPRVKTMTDRAAEIVTALFAAFTEDYARMPEDHAKRAREAHDGRGAAAGARVVADYVAGMTDRFAMQTHARLVDKR
jgi:dGTPase